TGFNSGFTPLVKAERLARELGVSELYIKDDSVNHPTFSYKDRVVSIAATRNVELGFPVFGCASTGNLANSVSAHAARLGLPCYVFIPNDLEPNKILGSAVYGPQVIAVEGNYDDVNRLCTQIADRYGWGFANINLRSYYAEGAKTMGFEIAEQLGWRFPDHLVSPVAGGTLLPRIYKGFREFLEVGLVEGKLPRIHAAQPTGSAPVIRALESGAEFPEPVKPNTIAKSLAIGNAADGNPPAGAGVSMNVMFPAFLDLKSRNVVVVGGGRIAASKIESLLSAGARVTVVAPQIQPEIARADVEMVRREFRETDLDGAW